MWLAHTSKPRAYLKAERRAWSFLPTITPQQNRNIKNVFHFCNTRMLDYMQGKVYINSNVKHSFIEK
jgi:hypothetical protein